MIVFAAITPSSPLLIASVNPERVHTAAKTRASLKLLSEELFAAKPDTVVIFCDHATTPEHAFAINVADPYHAGLAEFGDLGYSKNYNTDFMLADGIQRTMRRKGHDITLETEKDLPFSATVPLSFLTEHLPEIRIVPIAPCNKSPKEHFEFGAALREILVSSTKRIAVIACGDGSHTSASQTPQQSQKPSETFDDQLATLISQKNTAGLLQLNASRITEAQDASYRQIVMLFGVLDGSPVDVNILSLESPFGVGQLVAELQLQ